MKTECKSLKFKAMTVILFSFLYLSDASARDLKSFLKYCGYGTVVGAGVGLASLVFEKKPNESYGNIARGASLGLYAGIALGLLYEEKKESAEDLVLFPLIDNNKNISLQSVYIIRF